MSQAQQHQRPNLNLFKTCKLLGGLIKINAQLGTLGKRDIFLSRATFPFHTTQCACAVSELCMWLIWTTTAATVAAVVQNWELKAWALKPEKRTARTVCVCREYQIKIIFQLCALEFTAATAATKNQSTSIYVCRELCLSCADCSDGICMEQHNTTHRKE